MKIECILINVDSQATERTLLNGQKIDCFCMLEAIWIVKVYRIIYN
jgi:hypothetical protein